MLFLCTAAANAGDVEYISKEKQTELETLFKEAQFSPSKDAQVLKSKEWRCDMYGMRSRLQVQRGLKLYQWKEDSGKWQNKGAQLVSEYKSENSSLKGRRDRFEDEVKVTKDGQLVSRLSLASPAGSVIAYSVCKTL